MIDQPTSSSNPENNIALRITKSDNEVTTKCLCSCGAKRFIWPAFLVILTVMLGVLAVNSQIVSKEQKQRPKAFEKGHEFLSKIGEVYLEDYFYLTHVPAQFQLKHLEMSTTLVNKEMDESRTRKFYRASIRHLRKAAPNLQEVDLMGGYLWNLEEPLTSQLLKNELELLKNTLLIVKDSFMEANVSLHQYTFDAVYAIDRDEADAANYQQMLFDLFDYRLNRISVYYMQFSIPIKYNHIEILLNLSFDPKYKTKLGGRSRFLKSTNEDNDKTHVKFEKVGLRDNV